MKWTVEPYQSPILSLSFERWNNTGTRSAVIMYETLRRDTWDGSWNHTNIVLERHNWMRIVIGEDYDS